MKARVLVPLILAAALPGGAAMSQSYHLTSTAFGSGGGIPMVGPYRLGMTVGQSVTGMGSGPSVPLYLETAGFWHRGSLPVLDVPDAQEAVDVTQFALFPCAPNPFTLEATIRYAIPSSEGPTAVSLRLYDLSGRLVREIDSGSRGPGLHTATWDGRDESGHPAGGGIYFYRIEAGRFSASRRLVLIR